VKAAEEEEEEEEEEEDDDEVGDVEEDADDKVDLADEGGGIISKRGECCLSRSAIQVLIIRGGISIPGNISRLS